MIQFSPTNIGTLKLLCLGAHSDDIEIGCGGTILKWIRESKTGVQVFWVVFSASQDRAEEARKCADLFLKGASKKTVQVKKFRDGFFPYQGVEIKETFEQIKNEFSPDIIFTHCRDDRHQDHRLLSDLTWNTYRDHMILEYEIPKYDGDLGKPNCFVHLDESLCHKKADFINECFLSQNQKQWFSEDTLFSLLRLRGIESAASGKYAEAFHCRKMVI